jgi:hypothetical protein
LIIRVIAAEPAVAAAGEMEVIEGVGGLIISSAAAEIPPPGGALYTLIWVVPLAKMSEPEMAASICVLLMKVVGRSVPFQRTTELATKPLPFTVRENPPLTASTVPGEILLMEGTGFWAPSGTPTTVRKIGNRCVAMRRTTTPYSTVQKDGCVLRSCIVWAEVQ